MQGSLKTVDPVAVTAPKSESGRPFVADPLQIFISEDAIFIGQNKIYEHELFERISELAKENPEKQFLLKADADLDSTRFIRILKTIKQAGVTNVYMVTTAP